MNPQLQEPQRDLTVYLLKPTVQTVSDALRKPSELKAFSIAGLGTQLLGNLYVRPTRNSPPRWAAFFEGQIKASELGRVASTSAVLLIHTYGRFFAVTFGQGRYLLVPDCWEERFGLRVVLNSIKPDRLRSLDKRTFDALSTQSRVQSSREGSAPDFGLDVEQDLVRAVTGTPTDEALGKTLSGMDSLHASVRVTTASLKKRLGSYFLKNEEAGYKTTFPWVDHIAEVTDKAAVRSLDEALVDTVNGERERCWLCVPEIIDWASTGGFRYAFTAKAPEYSDLHFDGFFESLGGGPADLTTLKRRKAYRVGNEGHTLDEWSIYRCAYCEVELSGTTHVLSTGKWYKVDKDFVTAVNQYFGELPMYGPLPEYSDDSEGAYCKRVHEDDPNLFALMDQKPIPIGGAYGKVEYCDLLSSDRDLIHIKRYGASSVLSHLFSQGVVSAEAFTADTAFRAEVLKRLPPGFHSFSATTPITPSEYQVVFAIVSDREGELTLPFFSRVNIRHACRRLSSFGYRTAISKIQVAPSMAKLKKYPAK